MDETAGSTAAPDARCRKILRGSFIGVLLPHRLYCTRVNLRRRATRAWIHRTHDGLIGIAARGITLPLTLGLRHVPLSQARRLGYINHATGRKVHGSSWHEREVPAGNTNVG